MVEFPYLLQVGGKDARRRLIISVEAFGSLDERDMTRILFAQQYPSTDPGSGRTTWSENEGEEFSLELDLQTARRLLTLLPDAIEAAEDLAASIRAEWKEVAETCTTNEVSSESPKA